MRSIFIFCLLMSGVYRAQAQTAEQMLTSVNTVDQANQFISSHPAMKPLLFTISSDKDTSAITLPLFTKKNGYTFRIGNDVFRIISSTAYPEFRASYLFLDGSVLSKETIDSLRQSILDQCRNGALFFDVIRQYYMDMSTNGDLGWFREKTMMPEFEAAIRQYKKGDLFTVDVPENKWYYVVMKTFDDRVTQELTLLKITAQK